MACHTTCPSSKGLASSLLLAAILSGCASQPTLRIVDAKSGAPLGNVRVERLEGCYRPSAMPFVVLNALSPVEKQTTNESGAVTFQKSGSKFMVNPSGDNSAYHDAYVSLTWWGAKVRTQDGPKAIHRRLRANGLRVMFTGPLFAGVAPLSAARIVLVKPRKSSRVAGQI